MQGSSIRLHRAREPSRPDLVGPATPSSFTLAFTESSAEGEGERFDAGVEELDLEATVVDRARLADELVHPLVVRKAVAVPVDVDASGRARCPPVDADAEAHRSVAERR